MKNVMTIIKHHIGMVFKKRLSILTLIVPMIPILVGSIIMQKIEIKPYGVININTEDHGEVVEQLIEQLEAENIEVVMIDKELLQANIESSKQGIYIEVATRDLFDSLKREQEDIYIYQVGEHVTDKVILQEIDTVLRVYGEEVKRVEDKEVFLKKIDERNNNQMKIEVLGEEVNDNFVNQNILGIFILLFLLVCGKNLDIVIKEKQNNVYTRLKMTPVTKGEYLLGHIGGALIIMGIQSVIIVGGMVLFNIEMGIPVGYFMALCLVLAVVGVGISLFTYQFTKTVDVYFIGTTVTATLLCFMGGGLFPNSILPKWMQTFALISPITWVVKAYEQFILTSEWIVFTQYLGIALLISAVIIAIAIYKEYGYK